ncbi:MAG: tRNA 2-thiouridine(34) synthase MnmA [Steroidobacteraceae bacterium]|nr:tRNA 2-thiouridine(34) synthase MnmA [Steroidobacteraceae bacterium]
MHEKPSDLDPARAGTVIVGMSGGVDSAVAALRLLERGYAVQGLFMSNWDEDDAYCTAAADYQDARRVCEILRIALHRANFAADYRHRVFSHFLRVYAAGGTPNPDVLCNREIKFGVCLEHMRRLGAAWVATGHYARIEHGAFASRLLKAADPAKDQSYFLHAVDASALPRMLFPIGDLEKTEVRRRAHAAGLPVHDKPDSTGICFIGERPFAEFLGRYIAPSPGPIETEDGRVLGEHRGLPFYTLGQRAGLRLGGRAGARAAPWYVAAKDTARNALTVVQSQDHPLLLCDAFEVIEVNWLVPPAGATSLACAVKTRHRQADLPCRLHLRADGRVDVSLLTAARAVTPGQYAVFYDGDVCLGGGTIVSRPARAQIPAEPAIAYNSAFSTEES